MFAKYTTAGLVGSALLATVAFAQSPSSDDKSAAPPAATTAPATPAPAATAPAAPSASTTADASFQGNWRASKLVGLTVYNDNNESLGSISDLLTDKTGNIKAVVIGVGGFLGVGEHLVAVPMDKIKFVNEPVAYTGVSGGPPGGSANRPASSTTTGAASSNTAPAAKANPWYPDHAVFSATKDQLKGMPEFKYST